MTRGHCNPGAARGSHYAAIARARGEPAAVTTSGVGWARDDALQLGEQ